MKSVIKQNLEGMADQSTQAAVSGGQWPVCCLPEWQRADVGRRWRSMATLEVKTLMMPVVTGRAYWTLRRRQS
ncbi:hypothetical protein GHT09_012795 [Marmota monax]|uniref:Uncharacterized protein n=1 Tax=Marmota monax TaxID=9995 RepID=A0A834UXL2_MARMO|nr:hypothetical protein GHT09_012795 [Marmota monax]